MQLEKLYDNFINLINLSDLGHSIDYIDSKFFSDGFKDDIEKRAECLTIGGSILVKNQESFIQKSIDSAKKVCDTVIVCDTGSTDGTLDIIKKNMGNGGLDLVEIPWQEDYAFMRNSASDFLETDWILILDSDEEFITDVEKKSLKEILACTELLLNSREIALCFKQKSKEVNGSGFPQRLYINNPELKFWGYVHEELRSPNLISIKTKITIFNNGTDPKEMEKFKKHERYDSLLLKNLEMEPHNPKWLSLLSVDYIIEHSDWYFDKISDLVSTVTVNEQIKEPNIDFFEMKLFMNYINLMIQKEYEQSDITSMIDFCKKRYYQNPIFFYFDYFLKIKKIRKEAEAYLKSLSIDVGLMKMNASEWDVFFPIDYIEEILVNLLMKAEKYSVAADLVCDYSKISKKELDELFLKKL
ncbi:glycosyltransferase family 2 protein [Streptococcus gordonii]|jgi:glycosyltransferase, family 2|uniref:glycosyltransferase n=1 Tax=Streptococcus gordonii TaxID=1302 RepID=UPI002284E054|nr:glycosyltransferase [Streptococcus gordonii]MCY7139462.1 glycosyltransferase family 2 protein [Streptococcus gordonii]